MLYLSLYNRNLFPVNAKIVYDGCLIEEQYKNWLCTILQKNSSQCLLFKKIAYFILSKRK